MSDLKNVLKAGFLVTASLLATGCGDDNNDGGTTPNPNPNPSPSDTVQKSILSTFSPDVGNAVKKLKEVGGLGVVEVEVPAAGYGTDFDVFAKAKFSAPATALSSGATASAAALGNKAMVALVNLKMKDTESLLFDVSNTKTYPVDANHVGALILEGFLDKTVRNVATGKVKGNLRVPALVLRNTILKGEGAATVAPQYLFLGADAAIGYDSARVDNTGKAVKLLNLDVHSLSAGTAKGTGKSTDQKKVADPHAAKGKAQEKVGKAPVKATAGALVLRSLKLTEADWQRKLNDAGLMVHDKDTAQFDIAGRVAEIEAENVIIAGVSDAKPELFIPETVAVSTAVKTEPKKTSKSKTSLALSGGTAAKSKSPASPAKGGKAPTKTASAPSTSQGLVKTATGGHKFLFDVKEGGLFAEVGKLIVGANTDIQAIAHYTLTVHELDLTKADLGFRVLAEGHTFEKLAGVSDLTKFDTSATDKAKAGQEMMKLLADADHAVHESDVVEEAPTSPTVEKYQHFDEHVPFALYVTNTVTGADKKHLVLRAVDLDAATTLGEGVYVLPLVKDFTGTLRNNAGSTEIVLGTHDDKAHATMAVKSWKIMSNGYHDLVLAIQVGKKAVTALGSGAIQGTLMASKAQDGRSVEASRLDSVVARLNPTNLIAASFANVSTSRINQAAQFASLARGVNVATAEKLGAVEQYTASFNHNGAQVGFTYSLSGGDAFAGSKGTTSFGANVASKVLGLTAIVSADASADAGKNPLASASHASYNAGLTLAKSYSLGGLSVVPMAGFGVASNAINGYSAVVPMAAGSLGLHMNDVSFSAATFHAGVNVALDEFVAATAGVNASLAFGVAGYLASTVNATLSTSEGKSADLQFGGSSVAPYAQFNLGFASGEKVNALISTGIAAVNFGIDR